MVELNSHEISQVDLAETVLNVTSAIMDVPIDEITRRGRAKKGFAARLVVVAVLLEESDWSLTRLGRLLGGRDHSTITNSRDRFRQLVEQDEAFKYDYEAVRERLGLSGSSLT